jgi:hypothetical protein
MRTKIRFPLYVLKGADSAGIIFREHGSEKNLLVFTTAENASVYRCAQSLNAHVTRLMTPAELRELIAEYATGPEFKVEIDR